MAANYNYDPIYGVEPWKDVAGVGNADYGGGAEVTNDNLLISLWQVTASDPFGTPTAGRLLRPLYTTADAAALDAGLGISGFYGDPGSRPTFKSRTSAKFYLPASPEAEDPTVPPFLALLNPPSDVKAIYANAIKASLNPMKPLGLNLEIVKACVYDDLAFGVYYINNGGAHVVNGWVVGSPVSTQNALPFARTSGANGVFPSFYNSLGGLQSSACTPAEFLASIDALNRGDFYVPIVLSAAENASYHWQINWPQTVARGG